MDDFGSIEDFKKGDASAFESLSVNYQDRIYNLCRYFLENPQDADDPGTLYFRCIGRVECEPGANGGFRRRDPENRWCGSDRFFG
jgi:hypothetical protein